MTQWPALGPPTRTLITCCPFCRAWRIVWSVAWPLPSDPYWVPMIVVRVLIGVFLLSFGVVVISILSHKVTCGQVSGFLLPRVTRVQHLRRRVLRGTTVRSEEHTSELQSRGHLVCRLLLEKKKYTLLYQQQTCHQDQPNQKTYKKRKKY